jgi:hypothetical protein
VSERIYYLVGDGSPVMEVIQQAISIEKRYHTAIRALQGEFPGCEVWVNSWHEVTGIGFKGPVPAGWRKLKTHWVPDRRTIAGKRVAARLDSLPKGVSAMRFSSMLSGEMYRRKLISAKHEFTHHGDGQISFSIFEKYGNSYVLSVPLGCKLPAMPGCTELKMSEYWQIKESVKEQGAA